MSHKKFWSYFDSILLSMSILLIILMVFSLLFDTKAEDLWLPAFIAFFGIINHLCRKKDPK